MSDPPRFWYKAAIGEIQGVIGDAGQGDLSVLVQSPQSKKDSLPTRDPEEQWVASCQGIWV